MKIKTQITLEKFNSKFSKIVDELEKSGLDYAQIEDVMCYTFSEKRVKKYIEHLKEGLSGNQIAKLYGTSHSVISSRVQKYYNKKMESKDI